jgi:replication factor A1
LGINFDKEKVKINEILPGMKKVNLMGKIINLFPVREYEKNGRKGKVVNFILADESGNIRTVLWDTNHIKLIEEEKIKEGDFVEISNARMRNTELHLSGFSDIKKSEKTIDNVKTERDFFKRKISNFDIGGNFKTRAVIVQAFEPKFFEVCPECGKRAVKEAEGFKCERHGKVSPNRRALIPLVLDDGSESIRAVLFSEQIKELGINKEELENFVKIKQDVLGRERWFSGRVKQNKMFNNKEMLVNKVEEIDLDKLIKILEK